MCWVSPVPGSRAASGGSCSQSNWQIKIYIHRSSQLKNSEVDRQEGCFELCCQACCGAGSSQWLSEFYLVRNKVLTGSPSLAFSCHHSPPM